MKKYLFILLSVSCAMLMSCGGDEPASPDNPEINWFDSIPADKKIIPPDVTPISGLNLETFPIIDGSDSTQPIRELLAATLLGATLVFGDIGLVMVLIGLYCTVILIKMSKYCYALN